ncbi:O-antigen ligase family protein [Bdellovibrio sp. HCB-110]|uniref:O-antigen ligase family protein n=1 Tax=Bdellovibrio sp. HCB-110 TaxID=3391182 RepID=UPI0039B388BE
MQPASESRTKLFLSVFLIAIATLNLISRTATEYSFIIFILAVIALSTLIKKEDLQLKNIFSRLNIEWQFTIWIFAIIASHLINRNLNESEISEIGEYRWMLGIYPLVAALLFTGVKRSGLRIFLLIISLMNLYFFIKYFLHPPIPGVLGYPSRLTGFYASPTDFGHTLLFPFMLSLCFLLLPDKNRSVAQFSIDVFITTILTTNLLLSYTRSVQLACAIGTIILCFHLGRKYLISLIVVITAFLAVSYATNFLWMGNRISFSLTPAKTYDTQRIHVIQGNWAVFLDNPIFGVGYHHNQKHLRSYYDKWNLPADTLQAHAHNQYLNLLAGTGLVGTLAYLFLMGTFLYFSWKNYKNASPNTFDQNLALTLFLILVSFVIAGLTDTNFELLPAKYYLLFAWGLILYQKQIFKAARKEAP